MELSLIIPHIEALIFASEKPLTNLDLVELLNNAMGFIEDRATLDQVEAAVDGISEKYNAEFYAFELKQSGGGWQFLTKREYHKTVAQLNGDKFLKRLSTAALETLAIIAYKQPATKSEIEAIRGVNCDYAVQKLLEKDLVIIAGRNEAAVGKPLIYATSKSFMDYFGINSTDDLPKINEVLMEEMVHATVMNGEQHADNDTEEIIPTPMEPNDSGVAITEEAANAEEIAILSEEDANLDETIGETLIEQETITEEVIEVAELNDEAIDEDLAAEEVTEEDDKRKDKQESGDQDHLES